MSPSCIRVWILRQIIIPRWLKTSWQKMERTVNENRWQHCGQKEEIAHYQGNFLFCHDLFENRLLQRQHKLSLCWKGLTVITTVSRRKHETNKQTSFTSPNQNFVITWVICCLRLKLCKFRERTNLIHVNFLNIWHERSGLITHIQRA